MDVSYSYEHSTDASAPPESVWGLWSDVTTWPQWDGTVEQVDLSGSFEVGAEGTMKFHGQPPLPFRLSEVTPQRGFVVETSVPDGVIRFGHRIDAAPEGGVSITHYVEIEGPEAFASHLGPMIAADIPQAMGKLARLAEKEKG